VETTLHRELKHHFGPGSGGSEEVTIAGYRIDAINGSGDLIEVQSGPLGPLRRKLVDLLPSYRIRVVKPIAIRRRVVRRCRTNARESPGRMSPKRQELYDVFEDLIGIASIFPHPNLTIEILATIIEEIRIPRRSWPGYVVADRRLAEIVQTISLAQPDDFWQLLPDNWNWRDRFTTHDLARRLQRSVPFAQRIAYCLRLSGAARQVDKSRNSLIYERCESFEAISDPANS
jgi:hypothetical protein